MFLTTQQYRMAVVPLPQLLSRHFVVIPTSNSCSYCGPSLGGPALKLMELLRKIVSRSDKISPCLCPRKYDIGS